MKDNFVKQCLEIFKRDDVKQETKLLMTPIIDIILHEIYPYLYLIILLVAGEFIESHSFAIIIMFEIGAIIQIYIFCAIGKLLRNQGFIGIKTAILLIIYGAYVGSGGDINLTSTDNQVVRDSVASIWFSIIVIHCGIILLFVVILDWIEKKERLSKNTEDYICDIGISRIRLEDQYFIKILRAEFAIKIINKDGVIKTQASGLGDFFFRWEYVEGIKDKNDSREVKKAYLEAINKISKKLAKDLVDKI
jgi:hypothetical protein